MLRPSSSRYSSSHKSRNKASSATKSSDTEELDNIEKVHGLRLKLEQELERTRMEEEVRRGSRARVHQEVESLSRQSTLYRQELKSCLQNTENLYRNVDQFIGQAMEINNDLEDFLNQKNKGRGNGQKMDNFKSYRSARMYNTSVTENTKDSIYLKRSVDKSIRSNSQTSLDGQGKDYLYTANRRLQTYEEWMMLKWQEMKEKSRHEVRWTPVKVEPPKQIDLNNLPPAKDVKILYREYDSKSGRISKVIARNPDGAKIEFRADPPEGSNPARRKKSPYKARPRIIDPETAATYKLPSYNFGGYNGQTSYARKPLKFEHPNGKTKDSQLLA